jgi:hypothetical protein
MRPPMPEIKTNINPILAHTLVVSFHNKNESISVLKLPNKKNAVRKDLCLPNAYSLIIRQLGLNSGLRKCNTNKQSNESTPLAIINLASVIIFYCFGD